MENQQDFVIKSGILTKYIGPGGEVVIPAGVTEIGKGAFRGCGGLTSVVIPEGVTVIGEIAFKGCDGLTSVVIPDSVTAIGSDAFEGCVSLTDVTLPGHAVEFGTAFDDTPWLKKQSRPFIVEQILIRYPGASGEVAIPEGVTKIGERAFNWCDALTGVTFPKNLIEIGSNAFSGCEKLTSVTIPEGVRKIGDSAFSGCKKLTGVTIPKSVTEIGRDAFQYHCRRFTIHAPAGSYAEQFAKSQGISFKALSDQ